MTTLKELPFDTSRVARHVAIGDLGEGDFLATWGYLTETAIISRPTGREQLMRGDAGSFITHQGNVIKWSVVAIIDETALVVTNANGIESSVAVSVYKAITHEQPPAHLRELFEQVTVTSVWNQYRHKLDLWDWIGDTPVYDIANPEIEVVVRAEDNGGWRVSSTTYTFLWTPVGGRNIITECPLRFISMVAKLFLGRIEIQ